MEHLRNPLDTNDIIYVVIYARVSTEHEEQLYALGNQIEWYDQILKQHPNWVLVKRYIDEGITGTSTTKRKNFSQMMHDAESGDFSLIITREVSRFARNTVDTLQCTRNLKKLGVQVYFIEDNIKTFDGDGELRLTIMATLAQDESRKTSIRAKNGQKISMGNGVLYGNGNILGYDRVGREFKINPEQARTVKMIYDMYLDGMGIRKIQFELEKAGRLTSTGKTNWYESNISKILRNPFYCGTIVYRKEYVPDYLEQKKVRNYGEVEQIVKKGTYEPIISEEEFERVQKILDSKCNHNQRNRKRGIKPKLDVWCRVMICQCGHQFNRKVWHNTSNGKQYGYQCYSSIRTGTPKTREKKGLSTEGICDTPMIAGWKLQMMAKYVFSNYWINNTNEIINIAYDMVERHIDDKEEVEDNTELIELKQAEIKKLQNRLNNLIGMRADGEISKDTFSNMKKETESQIDNLQEELSKYLTYDEMTEEEEQCYEDRLKVLKYALDENMNFDTDKDIPEHIIDAFVEKIVVSKEGFDWYLRFNPDTTVKCNVNGKRSTNAQVVSSLCNTQLRQQLTKEGINSYILIHEFLFSLDYAKQYQYSYSTKNRVLQWNDILLKIYI